MKRLTFDGLFCDIAMCKETPGGTFCENGSCSQRKVWERLKEYEDMEEQDRLVVLPCVAQTDIERDGHIYRGDHWSHILTAFREDPTSPSGMRVALIDIEEAERALEGVQGDA